MTTNPGHRVIAALALLSATAVCHPAAAQQTEQERLAQTARALETIALRVEADLRRLDGGPARAPHASGDEQPADLVASTRRFYDQLVSRGLPDAEAAPQPPQRVLRSEVDPQDAMVADDRVPVLQAPGAGQPRLALAAKGSRAAILDEHGDWCKVVFENGAVGWVARKALRVAREVPDAGGSRLVTAAREFLGVPYVWGGASSSGVDCSGLIQTVMRRFGVRVPHSAAALFRLGQPVPRDSLRTGDLVFFKNTYKPGVSHVGIYVSGDQFIHASSGQGRVTVSSLKLPYFVRKWAGARRLGL